MGLPSILIEFKTKASTAIKRGNRGVVAIMIKDSNARILKIENITQIPSDITTENKAYIERAFLGGVNSIKNVVLIITDEIENALSTLETQKYDYVVAPPDVTEEETAAITIFIKGLRDNKNIKVKAVVANSNADHEGIINFTTDNIVVGNKSFTAAQYCSRIAGLLAGTPLQQSATYYVLSEVENVPKYTKAELDTKIDNGEFVIFHDGEKVKVGRAINSLKTVGATKSEDYKSIKIIDIMDLIYSDIKLTCEDNYIGKFPNSYNNKCNLIVAIQAYLESLMNNELLDETIKTEIDMQEQTIYLKEKGYDVDGMSELEIKKANTDTKVFLRSNYKILNAIEDISVKFFI